MPSSRLNINPSILSFAREMSGYMIPDIAKKLDVKEEKWMQWESGEIKPTSNQLLNIAKQLDRTPAFFYLNSPPAEKPVLSEFRTINNVPLVNASPKLIKAIREAKRNRQRIIDLYGIQNLESQRIPQFEDLFSNIEYSAKLIREWLGVSIIDQNEWKNSSNALSKWKELIENKDIYIVQYPFVEIEESRGFALYENEIPIIGINSKDSYNGRIFTLLHELCHVLIGDSIVVNNSLDSYFNSSSQELERLCNSLTAEILVPSKDLEQNFDQNRNQFQEVKKLISRYRVSGQVILIKLKKQSLITEANYRSLIFEFTNNNTSNSGSTTGNPYNNQVVRKGKLLLKTAFDAYFNERISLPELSEIASWKVPNLNKLAANTFGWSQEGNYI